MTKENKAKLEELYRKDLAKNYPNFPERAYPMPKFSDKTANELTKTIKAFITYIGGQAERISSTGRVIDKTEVSTDVLGRKRTIGSVHYIPSTSTNGTADISAIYRGKSFKIEVKIGADKMSQAQIKYKANVERAGGIYIIARNFDDFLTEFRNHCLKR